MNASPTITDASYRADKAENVKRSMRHRFIFRIY